MAPNLNPDIAALPLYQLGFAAGVDVGLVIALSAITSERKHQERLDDRDDSGSPAARVYADGALSSVARVLGARFRSQGQQEVTR
jgi:hypothetical protein